jgi:hypothetical protein
MKSSCRADCHGPAGAANLTMPQIGKDEDFTEQMHLELLEMRQHVVPDWDGPILASPAG